MLIERHDQEHLHGQGEENGDCLRAATASILGLPMDQVPHFCSVAACESEKGWATPYHQWLRGHGLTSITVPWHRDWVDQCMDGAVYLLIGPSPRFPQEPHVVVAQGTRPTIIHDPHPDRSGILPPNEHVGWSIDLLVTLQPEVVAYAR